MKILGAIIYAMGFLGVAYMITEAKINFGDSFGGIVGVFLWLLLTMGIGTALMNAANNKDK